MKSGSILFIAYSGPCPPRDGKRQRTYALLQALSTRYQVDFLIINHEPDFRVALEQFPSDSVRFFNFNIKTTSWDRIKHKLGFVFPDSGELTKHINTLCSQKDYTFVFSRYIQPVLHIPENQKIIADIDDDFEEQYKSRIRNAKSFYPKLRLIQIYWVNKESYNRLLRKLDLAITVKEDSYLSKSLFLPNLPFQLMLEKPISFQENLGNSILFVGKLTYYPNLEGIMWFIEKVFPLLQRFNPKFILTIVSNLPSIEREFLDLVSGNPAIRLEINVNNLTSIYQTHALAIAPIFQGAGSNIKVIEALKMGRPIITTSFGVRGFEELVKENLIFRADTPDDFCQNIIQVMLSRETLIKIQKKAFEFFQASYSLEKWNEKLLNGLEKCLSDSPSGIQKKLF